MRFFFRSGSAQRLGISRALFCGGLLLVHGRTDFSLWAEVTPLFFAPLWPWKLVGGALPSVAVVHGMQIAWKIALLLCCVGLFTRASAAVAFVLGIFLFTLTNSFGHVKHVNGLPLLTLGVLALARSGDAFSLDSYRRRTPEDSPEYTWPIRTVWMLAALVFFAAGYTKLRATGLAWAHPDNLAIRLLRNQYGVGDDVLLTSWGLWVARQPILCSALAIGTLVIETGFPLALYSRVCRWIWVPASLMMLVGIRLLMGPNFLPFAATYVFWIPWERLRRRRP